MAATLQISVLRAIPPAVTTFSLFSCRIIVYILFHILLTNPLAARGLVLNSERWDFTDNTKESELA